MSADVDAILAELREGSMANVWDRIEALLRLRPDPKVIGAISDLTARPTHTGVRSQPMWTLAMLLLAAQPDEPLDGLWAALPEDYTDVPEVMPTQGAWMNRSLALLRETRPYLAVWRDEGPDVEAALHAVREAAEVSDHERMVTALLDAWLGSQDDRLAELLTALDHTRLGAESMPRKTGKAGIAAWLERDAAGRAIDVGPLAERLADGRSSDHVPKLVALLRRPPDPRIGAALVALLEDPPSRVDLQKHYWQRVFYLLARHASETQLLRCEAIAKDLRELRGPVAMVRQLRHLVRRWSVREVPDLSRLKRRASAEAGSAQADLLLEQIYADPADDGIKAVYGDLLLEQGDPRGELIQLQFSGKRGTKKRINELLKNHRPEWMGPLARVFSRSTVTFEGGFPATGQLAMDTTEAEVAEVADAREWATWRVLEGLYLPPPKATPCLKVALGLSGRTLLTWCQQGGHPTVEQLAAYPRTGMPAGGESLAALLECEGFAALRHLWLDVTRAESRVDFVAGLLASPVGRRLDTLALSSQAYDPSDIIASLLNADLPVGTLEFGMRPTLKRHNLPDLALRFPRQPDGSRTVLEVHVRGLKLMRGGGSSRHGLLRAIGKLRDEGADIQRAELHAKRPNADVSEWLERGFAALDVPLTTH